MKVRNDEGSMKQRKRNVCSGMGSDMKRERENQTAGAESTGATEWRVR